MENEEQSPEEIERQRRTLYKRVFGSNDGMRVLRDLTANFNHNAPSFQGDFNSHAAAQRDGTKLVINYILRLSTSKSHE